MADEKIRRRCRDERRIMTYREAVLCGRRRPWTEKQVKAAKLARRLDRPRSDYDSACGDVLTALGYGSYWLQPVPARSHWLQIDPDVDKVRTWPRLRAWAERVLRETAELNGA